MISDKEKLIIYQFSVNFSSGRRAVHRVDDDGEDGGGEGIGGAEGQKGPAEQRERVGDGSGKVIRR